MNQSYSKDADDKVTSWRLSQNKFNQNFLFDPFTCPTLRLIISPTISRKFAIHLNEKYSLSREMKPPLSFKLESTIKCHFYFLTFFLNNIKLLF